ncbi:MAG TPA: hypothetical protein VGR25_08045 [bacterium]|jgi:hypothetical protein|nr:hypothetical protein [bacterium]
MAGKVETMRQVTLVAFYGPKPEAIESLIKECQDRIAQHLRTFNRKPIEEVHATMIGLERLDSRLNNRNFSEYRGETREMDLLGFREYLLRSGQIPFTVQIGGFQDRDYSFTSRGQRPHARSFSIQGKLAVVMGWPFMGHTYPMTLDTIRRSAQSFGILHLYNRSLEDVDNDLYFRIGVLDSIPAQGEEDSSEAQADLRRFLADRDPLVEEVGISDLSFVSYPEGEETLPFERTKRIPLDTEDYLLALYD